MNYTLTNCLFYLLSEFLALKVNIRLLIKRSESRPKRLFQESFPEFPRSFPPKLWRKSGFSTAYPHIWSFVFHFFHAVIHTLLCYLLKSVFATDNPAAVGIYIIRKDVFT